MQRKCACRPLHGARYDVADVVAAKVDASPGAEEGGDYADGCGGAEKPRSEAQRGRLRGIAGRQRLGIAGHASDLGSGRRPG